MGIRELKEIVFVHDRLVINDAGDGVHGHHIGGGEVYHGCTVFGRGALQFLEVDDHKWCVEGEVRRVAIRRRKLKVVIVQWPR